MRISLKVLGLMWLGLFLVIGGLLFNAYSKFKPETFIALLTEQVQKNYPGAKLNVGKVSYRFSLDFNLNLQDIHLRRDDKLLGSIGVVELKVPWWLLLVNRGNAHINLKNLDIYVDHKKKNVETSGASTEGEKKPEDLIKVTLPSYLAEAKYTLRAKNITIRDLHNSRRYFVLSKLLVREFHYGKNSAFELNVPISITQNEIQYMSELWLFGDITPEPEQWKMNFRGEFRTKENNDKFHIEDLVIGGKGEFFPSSLRFHTHVNLEIEKKTIGKGEFKATQEDVFAKLSFTGFPVNYLGFAYEEIRNPYLQTLDGAAEGSFEFSKAFESATATFNGKFNFDGQFKLSPENALQGKWQIGFENNRWEVSFISPKGEASFFRRSFLDLKKQKVTQFNEELGFSGLDLSQTIGVVPTLEQFVTSEPQVFYSTTIAYKNCHLGDQVVNGNFKSGVTPMQKFYQGKLASEDSSLDIEYARKGNQNNLDIVFDKLNWHSSYMFLSPFFTAAEGIVDGKVEGRWAENWEAGQWLIQMKMENLNKPAGKLQDFIGRSFAFFNLKSGSFSNQTLNFSSKGQLISINSLMLEKPESVKLSGQLSTQQKSYLTLSYPNNKRFKPTRKEVLEPYWVEKEINNE